MFTGIHFRSLAAARRVHPQAEKGSTLVEFAVVVTLLLMLIFGVNGFGHALYAYHFVSHAAREATRYASVRGSTCANDNSCVASNSASSTAGATTQADVQTFVKNSVPSGLNSSKVTVTTCGVSGGSVCSVSPAVCNSTPNAPGCTVQVQVSYAYDFIFPLIRTTSMTLSSTSDLVIVH